MPGQSIKAISDGVIWSRSVADYSAVPTVTDIGYNAATGAVMWGPTNRTGDEAYENGVGTYSSTVGGWAAGDGVFCAIREETEQWWGYSITTGQEIWGPSVIPSTNAWALWPGAADIANGILYEEAADGIHAYNVSTGAKIWDFADIPSGANTAYGIWPTEAGGMILTNDAVIVPIGHSHLEPLFGGAALLCINATTGQELWNVTGWFASGAGSSQSGLVIADGEIVGYNGYDGQIYAFGQGLSATTVATSLCINNPNQVLITGAVTDQSPGQTCLGIPAAGTPAISDASMSQWMAYLYMQQPEPTNATGVPVTLSYIDPNGNYYYIGNTTSDITGHYLYTFTPTVPGTYRITATFGGSNSYYSSSAETFFDYAQPATTAAPTATPTSIADMYFVPAIAGLFVLIIIVLIVVVLQMLRKRP